MDEKFSFSLYDKHEISRFHFYNEIDFFCILNTLNTKFHTGVPYWNSICTKHSLCNVNENFIHIIKKIQSYLFIIWCKTKISDSIHDENENIVFIMKLKRNFVFIVQCLQKNGNHHIFVQNFVFIIFWTRNVLIYYGK